MWTRLGLILCFCGLFGAPLRALDCKDGGSTQADMNECAANTLAKSDAGLNARYKRITACLNGSGADEKIFVDAQRAWLKFRDAECKFQGQGSAGGSVQPMVITMCLDAITKARSKDLDAYLHCPEGDLACPLPNCTSGGAKP